MSTVWKYIFLGGAILLAVMAMYAIWFETLAPAIFVKAFLSLVVACFVVSVIQSIIRKPKTPEN